MVIQRKLVFAPQRATLMFGRKENPTLNDSAENYSTLLAKIRLGLPETNTWPDQSISHEL